MMRKKPAKRKIARRLPLLFAVLSFTVGVWGMQSGWIAAHLPVLPITDITVNETKLVNQHWVQAQLAPYQDSNLLTLPVNEITNHLKNNPWVKSVSIRRYWPDAVSVTINTYEPVAQWNQTGYLTVDQHWIQTPPVTQLADLPLLEGPSEQQALVWDIYQSAIEMSRKIKLPITRLVMTPWGSYRITFAKKIEVVLGKTDTKPRLERFIMAYNALEDLRTANTNVYVDLRYNDGLAIAWQNN